jgi:hypothetical protein
LKMVMKACFERCFGRLALAAAVALGGLGAVPATAEIRITEVMSSSGIGGTPDWFEATNYGSLAVDLTGWTVDDNTFSFGVSLPLNGVTSIAAGESVVFFEAGTLDQATETTAFKGYWGGSAATAQVGWYQGSGIGFSSNGDGVVLFDSVGVEQTPQTSFPAATAGSSFYWSYNPAGEFVLGSASNGIVSTVGTIPGDNGGISQTAFVSTSPAPAPFTVTNIGSPGSAAFVPEPSTVALAAAGIGLAGLGIRRRLR